MEGYRRSAHTVYNLHYHFVFGTKYRKPALKGEIAVEVRDLIREICKGSDIEILSGHVRPDHVHLLLSVPPNLAPSRVTRCLRWYVEAKSGRAKGIATWMHALTRSCGRPPNGG